MLLHWEKYANIANTGMTEKTPFADCNQLIWGFADCNQPKFDLLWIANAFGVKIESPSIGTTVEPNLE